MSTRSAKAVALKILLPIAILTLVGMIAMAGVLPGSRVLGAGTISFPRVTSITQITHDGLRKSNLLGDDSQLYVTELPGTNHVIAKVTLPGSDRSLVPSPFSSLEALDLSPDRTKLLVSSSQAGSEYNEFWTLPVTAGSPERIGDLTGRDAAWSKDGEYLAFGKGSVLSIASSMGKPVTELFTANGSVFAPRFSPDGKRIRFTVSDAEQGTTRLWEIGRDGSNPHSLLATWQDASTACCGNWSADGRYYIFQATDKVPYTDITVTSLWALPDSGTGDEKASPVALTNGPMSFGNVSPARGNQNIWAIGVRPAGEVVKYDPTRKEFTAIAGGVSATDVDCSSDGKWIAYVALPEETLWRSRADGTDRLQLTSAPEIAALPRWSPDGKQIAYVSMQPGKLGKISLIAANGGASLEILPDSGSQIDVNWSPDGTRIMFGDFAHDAQGLSIQILDLTTHKSVPVPGSEAVFSPRWSPNGRYIAALSRDNTSLKLFDFQKQKWSDWLRMAAGSVNYPVWSADSKSVYFDDFVNGDESIRRVKLGEKNAERVFVLGPIDRYVGAFGAWSGRTADGSWMFVRDRSTQEVYELSLEMP